MHPAELGHDERHELSHQPGDECLVTAELIEKRPSPPQSTDRRFVAY
jgi:hypothetical protein